MTSRPRQINKIALFWPNGFDTKTVIPLALGYVKRNLDNSKYDVRIFDCSIDDISADSPELVSILENFSPDLVGVSCWPPTWDEAFEILKVTKSINKDIVTVVGGVYAAASGGHIVNEEAVDFVFRGETELSFPIFLEEFEKENADFSNVLGLTYISNENKVVDNEMQREDDLDIIRYPDYSDIRLDDYIDQGYKHFTYVKHAPIWVTRGCPYRCGFCMAPLQNGRPIRTHSVEYIVGWISDLYHNHGVRHINIIDDNFTYHKKFAKSVCQGIIDANLEGLIIGTPSGIRVQRTDKELLRLMKRAGWEYIFVAPESGSVNTLKRMKKDLDPTIIPPLVQDLKDAGLKVIAFFIVGYPGDTVADLKDTLDLIRKCDFHFFYMFNFQPLPGTPIYQELVDTGEYSPDQLTKTTFSSGNIVYVTEQMKGVNFPWIRLREYFFLAFRNPSSVLFLIKNTDPVKIGEIFFSNTVKAFPSLFDKSPRLVNRWWDRLSGRLLLHEPKRRKTRANLSTNQWHVGLGPQIAEGANNQSEKRASTERIN